MKYFVVISCIYSHTWAGMFYCEVSKNLEVSYGQDTAEQCDRWAASYLTEKYNLHLGEFEWGYRCVVKAEPPPYQPQKLGG